LYGISGQPDIARLLLTSVLLCEDVTKEEKFMSERMQISQDRWSDYLSEVTTGNRGRLVAVDVIGPDEVSRRPEIDIPAMGAPLFALEYEPAGKGNDIILSLGEDSLDLEHTVTTPVELTVNLDDDGSLDSMEILDRNGARTKLNFIQ
jgi:hypothetical protein